MITKTDLQILILSTLCIFTFVSLVLYRLVENSNNDETITREMYIRNERKEPFFEAAGYRRDVEKNETRFSEVSSYMEYLALREEYDSPPTSENQKRLLKMVKALRKHDYNPIPSNINYDITNCPMIPPEGYPESWKILDIIHNWNPDDPTSEKRLIYQGLCTFDYETELEKAKTYREHEVPFILRNDPNILPTVERWSHPEYLRRFLGSTESYRTESSSNNHFLFSRANRNERSNWKAPIEMIKMTYGDWLEKANSSLPKNNNDPHWYFRLNGCPDNKCAKKKSDVRAWLTEELPFFKREESFYIVDPTQFHGINCRFGMQSVIAENHFDGSRNFVVLLGGERRYILAHPNQCENLILYPKEHPSGRHSKIDWSEPDLNKYPMFSKAMGNEVVLQAGDLLYLPTFWFHYIVSLEGVNFQCNVRSGITSENKKHIQQCGFF